MPARAYCSFVERADRDKMTPEELAFRQKDAEAMGQIFLAREEEEHEAWHQKKEEALMTARTRCQENSHRAPWGCQWFVKWKDNVQNANEHGQKLHVFFFQGKVGRGKMAWTDWGATSVQKRCMSPI